MGEIPPLSIPALFFSPIVTSKLLGTHLLMPSTASFLANSHQTTAKQLPKIKLGKSFAPVLGLAVVTLGLIHDGNAPQFKNSPLSLNDTTLLKQLDHSSGAADGY